MGPEERLLQEAYALKLAAKASVCLQLAASKKATINIEKVLDNMVILAICGHKIMMAITLQNNHNTR